MAEKQPPGNGSEINGKPDDVLDSNEEVSPSQETASRTLISLANLANPTEPTEPVSVSFDEESPARQTEEPDESPARQPEEPNDNDPEDPALTPLPIQEPNYFDELHLSGVAVAPVLPEAPIMDHAPVHSARPPAKYPLSHRHLEANQLLETVNGKFLKDYASMKKSTIKSEKLLTNVRPVRNVLPKRRKHQKHLLLRRLLRRLLLYVRRLLLYVSRR
jgi:hypothetical protein